MRAVLLAILLAGRLASAEEPRYAGSEVGVKQAAGVWTAIPGADPTYNPLVLTTVSFDPRWRVRERIHLLGHIGVETELTDSDTSTRERQPLFDDAWLQSGFAIPHGAASLRLYLPTSRESWARRRIFSLSPAVSFYHPWGRFTPRAGLRATWHAATEETAIYDAPSILGCEAATQSCDSFTHSGIRSTMASFVQAVGVDAALPYGLTATAEVWWIEGLLYPLEGSTSTRWRLANLYLLGAEWRPSHAWKLGAGFQTLNAQRAPDSSLQTPFFNRHTQLYLSLSRVF